MGAQPQPTERKTKYCQFCGAEIDIRAEICPKCGVRIAPPPTPQSEKNPALSLILSFLLPGLGQIYNGQVDRGVLMIFGAIIFGALILISIGIFLYLGLWVYGMYDAYKGAEAYNRTLGQMPSTPKDERAPMF